MATPFPPDPARKPESPAPAAAAAPPDPPAASSAPPDPKAEREARLAAALRENLKRRKVQARARRDAGGDPAA